MKFVEPWKDLNFGSWVNLLPNKLYQINLNLSPNQNRVHNRINLPTLFDNHNGLLINANYKRKILLGETLFLLDARDVFPRGTAFAFLALLFIAIKGNYFFYVPRNLSFHYLNFICFLNKDWNIVRLTQNSIFIEIPKDRPAETLSLLRQAIPTVEDMHFLQLRPEVDRETGDG